MAAKKTYHYNIHQSNIFKPLLITTAIILVVLSFYITYIADKNSMKTIMDNSIKSVEQIKLTRAFYVENIVKDLKKYAPEIQFSYKHEGVNGVVPLPTTLIRNLSDIFSEKTGTKYRLYSEFPFKNRLDRNLTTFQKEALHYTQKNKDGIYVKRDNIEGKEVLRVAVTDYMTSQACVNCHNAHPDRTWEQGKWRLGDKRGVLEVITPIDQEIYANKMLKYSILGLIVVMVLLLMVYYSYIFIKREKELITVVENTDKALQDEIIISTNNESLLEEYKKAIDMSTIVSKTNQEGIITYVNDEFCKTSKYSEHELLGKSHNIIIHEDQDPSEYTKLWNKIVHKKIYRGTLKNKAKDGSTYYVDATIIPILDINENILEFLAIRYDVTNHIQALEYAYTDTLTGIPNRKKFEEVFLEYQKQAERYDIPMTLVLIDIDDFKLYNDHHGHLVGDEILIILSKILQENVRQSDLVARWGGDEFVILFPHTEWEKSKIILNKIYEKIKEIQHPIIAEIKISIGVGTYKKRDTLSSLLERADKALYEAKEKGKNRMVNNDTTSNL